MPYELNWEPKGVVKCFFGHVTDDDFVQSSEKIQGSSMFDDLRYIINDFHDCADFSISDQTIKEISAITKVASATNPNIRVAFATTTPKIIVIATKFATSSMNPYQTRIFSTIRNARAWLVIPS